MPQRTSVSGDDNRFDDDEIEINGCEMGCPTSCLYRVKHVAALRSVPALLAMTTACDYEAEHMTMVSISIVAIAVYALAFPLLCLKQVIHYPIALYRDPLFIQRFKFLFINFTPEAQNFGLIVLLRNGVVSLISVVLVRVPPFRVTCMCMAMIAYLCLLMRYWPWTQTFLNVVDSIGGVCILVMIIVGVGIVDGEINELNLITLASSSLFTLMIVLVGSLVF
jgi:hypothetical protein